MTATSPNILILSGLTGIFGFIAVIDLLRVVIERYRQHVNQEIHTDLRAQFIELSPRQLLTFACGLALTLFSITLIFLPWPVAAGFALTGLLSPRFLLRLVEKRRRKDAIRQLPEALKALASALRAGTSLNKGLEQLARRQPPPLAQEFALVISKQQLGESLETALDDMAKRIGGEEITLFQNAVAISHRVGGDLADTLDRLSMTLRERAQMETRIQALTAMGRMQGRVMCILPVAITGVLYMQQPRMMERLFTEPIGLGVLVLAGVMMLLAIISIRRIVAIDV